MLQFLVRAKVVEVLLRGGNEEVSLRAVTAGLAQALVELGVKTDGVERHLDVWRSGELRTHSTHALAGGTFALVRFALDDEDVAAAGVGEIPGDAGADDSSADNDDVCGFHDENIVEATGNPAPSSLADGAMTALVIGNGCKGGSAS